MPRDKLRRDVNETAFDVVQAATGQGQKPKPAGKGEPNPTAAARGRKGGKKGGKARAKVVGALRRRMIARKAARTRWASRDTT
jgi:hypothetical protein